MTIYAYKNTRPNVGDAVFIAPNAAVIGNVQIGKQSGLWFGVTVRGDVNHIIIGEKTNIQDNTCVHVTRKAHPTIIGSGVTIGHHVTLHGCVLEDLCFVGMHACVMDGAIVETGGMVAAGALVTPNKRIKAGELWAGSPARLFRQMTQAEKDFIAVSRDNYVRLAGEYLQG